VDTKQFYDPLSPAKQPRGKQLVPTVGTYYTTTPRTGCDIAQKAFSIAAEKIPNLRLVAFGSGNTPHPNLRPDGTEYNKALSKNQVKEFYSKCEAWLFSSRAEGFGLPIIEAMASACPNSWPSCGCGSGTTCWGGWHTCQAKRPTGYGKSDRADFSVV